MPCHLHAAKDVSEERVAQVRVVVVATAIKQSADALRPTPMMSLCDSRRSLSQTVVCGRTTGVDAGDGQSRESQGWIEGAEVLSGEAAIDHLLRTAEPAVQGSREELWRWTSSKMRRWAADPNFVQKIAIADLEAEHSDELQHARARFDAAQEAYSTCCLRDEIEARNTSAVKIRLELEGRLSSLPTLLAKRDVGEVAEEKVERSQQAVEVLRTRHQEASQALDKVPLARVFCSSARVLSS